MFYRDTNANRLLELVGSAMDSSSRPVSVLRAPDGSFEIVLSTNLVAPNYEPFAAKAGDPTNEAIKEALQNIRQNSTLRFAAVPIFFTAFGALAKFYFVPGSEHVPDAQLVTQWLGLGVAIWFGVIEIFLSRNLIRWWNGIATLTGNPNNAWCLVREHRDSEASLWIVRILLFLPYAVAAGFWASTLLAAYDLPRISRFFWNLVILSVLPLLMAWFVWTRAKGNAVLVQPPK
jgi:hypothetical protein